MLAELGAGLRGQLILPSSPHYDDARRVWNAMHDALRPSAIVQCAGEDDVAHAVRCARAAAVPLAIRGGGHHVAGFGTCDGGLVIDLRLLRHAIPIDEGRRIVVGGGATLHDVDVAGDAAGRAVPVGVVSQTGIGGLTLSGGIGWLTRLHGYTCDNLCAADVVTADGEFVHASEDENADLLWGLRGGGGNFGVVTQFEFETHRSCPAVVVGEAYHLAEDERSVEDVLRFYRGWTTDLPREVTVWIVIERVNADYDLLPDAIGQLAISMLGCYAGDSVEAGERLLSPLRREGTPTAHRTSAMRLVELQHLQDQSAAAAPGMHTYMKGEMITELTDAAISGIAARAHHLPTQASLFEMGMVGGAMGERDEMDAAVGLRNGRYMAGFSMMSADAENLEPAIAWTREAWEIFADATAGGTYLNFSADESPERVLGSLGAPRGGKRARLAALKRDYDPGNVFRLNHNIDPGIGQGAGRSP
jgi:hypothetical protein